MAEINLRDGILPSFLKLGQQPAAANKTNQGKKLFQSKIRNAQSEAEAISGSLEADDSFSEEQLVSLLDDVHSMGDDLKSDPTTQHIQNYKKAVRDFLNYTVKHSYSLEEKKSGGAIFKRKKYFRITIIDEKLEKLAAEILKTHKDHLSILQRIDEINGMLIDLIR